jgi:hypothetical protein
MKCWLPEATTYSEDQFRCHFRILRYHKLKSVSSWVLQKALPRFLKATPNSSTELPLGLISHILESDKMGEEAKCGINEECFSSRYLACEKVINLLRWKTMLAPVTPLFAVRWYRELTPLSEKKPMDCLVTYCNMKNRCPMIELKRTFVRNVLGLTRSTYGNFEKEDSILSKMPRWGK